jgi:hypothetical protein
MNTGFAGTVRRILGMIVMRETAEMCCGASRIKDLELMISIYCFQAPRRYNPVIRHNILVRRKIS